MAVIAAYLSTSGRAMPLERGLLPQRHFAASEHFRSAALYTKAATPNESPTERVAALTSASPSPRLLHRS